MPCAMEGYLIDPMVATVPTYAGDSAIDIRVFDAEFIAHARTDIPALLAEVRRLQAIVKRVRELHQDEGQSQGYFPGDRDYGKRDHCCGTCGEYGEYGVEWPCPTVRAIADALGAGDE